jgi:glyoxylase-like metal-dependent hydrolase (beta-lactamase superfamily II)
MIGTMQPATQVHTIVSLPFAENTYLVWPTGRGECVVIDPGLEPELILEALRERQLRPVVILNTHGHADHIAGNETMKQAFPEAPLVIGEREQALLTDPNLNMSGGFGIALVSPPADRVVNEGDVIEAAGLRLEVLDIPGHSPGHVVFLLRGSPCLVFDGDVLFREGIGRTDFPGGSHQLLLDGIRRKLFTLPGDTIVYPGHGPLTTVEHERRANPFVNESGL